MQAYRRSESFAALTVCSNVNLMMSASKMCSMVLGKFFHFFALVSLLLFSLFRPSVFDLPAFSNSLQIKLRRLQRKDGGAGGPSLEEEDLVLRALPSSYLAGGRVDAPAYASDYHVKRFVVKVFDADQPMVTLALPFPASWTTGVLEETVVPVAACEAAPVVVASASSVFPAPPLPPKKATFIPDSGYKPLKTMIVNGMRTVLSTYYLRDKVE